MPITIQHGSLKYKDGNTFESVDCIKGDKGDTGEDGISPSASVSKSGTTTTISVTDKTGTTTAQVLDGTDGISPIASISKSGDTATITVTDATGTTTAQLTDGQTPVRGTDYWTASDQASILSDTETYADDLIAVQDTQPTASQTKIWLPATAPTSVQVPTYAEHTSLATTLAKVTPSNVGARGQMLINDGQGGALWENIASLSINLSSSFDTWEKIWAALDMIPLDGSVLIGISSTAMAVISSNARTSAAQGTITRIDTNAFDLLLRFSSNVAVCATLTSATSSGCTYSDKKMALESDLGDPSSASAVTGNDAFSKIATVNSKLDTVKKLPSKGTFSTVSELEAIFDSVASGMSDGEIYTFRVQATSTFSIFTNTILYACVLYRTGSTGYLHVMMYPNSAIDAITARKSTGLGWRFEQLALKSELTDRTGLASLGSFSTIAELETLLNNKLTAMDTGTISTFSVTASATIGVFVNTYIYFCSLYKKSSGGGYSYVMMYPNAQVAPISGCRYDSTTWDFDSLALNSNIIALDLSKNSLSNANVDLDNGMYYCTSATQNIPSGGLYGCMLNIKAGVSNARRIQLLMYATNIWIRYGSVSNNVLSWNSWMQVTATEV